MWYVIKEDELYHHGILGQKWGVRRYQNYDGSYTQAGLKRYRKSLQTYNDTVRKYEQGDATRNDVKAAKRKMNSDYKRLKTDKRADKGKNYMQQEKQLHPIMEK